METYTKQFEVDDDNSIGDEYCVSNDVNVSVWYPREYFEQHRVWLGKQRHKKICSILEINM